MFQAVPGAAAGPPGGGGVMDPVGPQVNCQQFSTVSKKCIDLVFK